MKPDKARDKARDKVPGEYPLQVTVVRGPETPVAAGRPGATEGKFQESTPSRELNTEH